jgi:multidrug efflux system membrane fusion protein
MQKITLGPQNGERVAVTSGLSPGDKVVTDGADKLRDGGKVTLRQESGAPADGATPPKQPRQRRQPSGGQ